MINVVDMIGSEFCVATEDARKLYDEILYNIDKEEKIIISFENAKLIMPVFFNSSICQLYGKFDDEYINKHVEIINLDEETTRMLAFQIKRAKRYFKNPELYNKIVDEFFNEYDSDR